MIQSTKFRDAGPGGGGRGGQWAKFAPTLEAVGAASLQLR